MDYRDAGACEHDSFSCPHRSFVSKLLGDRGHRAEGLVTVGFLAFLAGGLLYAMFH